MHRLDKMLRWGNLLLILFTFLSYLSPYINPVQVWPVTFFGMAYPWLLLLNLIYLIFWAVKKDTYIFFSLACIIMGWGHLTRFVSWDFPSTSTKESIQVMTYNSQALSGLIENKKFHKEKMEDLKSLVEKEYKVDILCLQEVVQRRAAVYQEYFDFPYYYKLDFNATGMFSKYPFLDKGGGHFKKSRNSYQWVDVEIKGNRIRVFNVHLQSNQVGGETDNLIREGDFQEKETWKGVRSVLGKIVHATQTRSRQAQQLAQLIRESPYPVIVCGDFNDTPLSFTYYTVSEGLDDAFQQKGFGLGTTYAGLIPALRIDYILCDPSLEILSCEIPKAPFSDHYPVVSRISIEK